MSKIFQSRVNACKDENDKIIIEERTVLDRWAELFQDLHNAGEEEVNENPIFLTTEPYVEKPSINEVEDVIKQRNGRTSGED